MDGLTTIRYLDDFAILGPTVAAVEAGFRAAQEELAKLGMTCYVPGDGSQKAFLGHVERGFDFLGCRVHPDGVSPARRARRKLVAEVGQSIRRGKARIRAAVRTGGSAPGRTSVRRQTLVEIDRKIRGWGDAFRFVTNRVAFAQVDGELDGMLGAFHGWFCRRHRGAVTPQRRRIYGVAVLGDTPPSGPD